jgi:flagellar hook assembly protein FlgD
VVASSANMALDQLFNYPNPVNDFTTFSFEHNQANENLEITVDVYSIDGKLATSFTKKMLTNGYRNNQIDWDVTDESGNRIKKGVYIYRMIVKSESGKEASETAKLVILK